MSMMNTEAFWQYVIKGFILLLAVWVDIKTKK
jgi:D-xylose transport system permease protein